MKATELRRLRLRAGDSQTAFAKKLGLHRNAVSNYERGRKIPLYIAIAARCVVEHRGR